MSEAEPLPENSIDAHRVIAQLQKRIGLLTTDLAVRDILLEDARAQLPLPEDPPPPTP